MVKQQRNFLRLRHARAHVDGALKNPLFLKMKTPRWRIVLSIFTGCVLCIFGAIAATHIPIFQLHSVSITGNTLVDARAVEQSIRDTVAHTRIPFVAKTNITFTKISDIEQALMSQFPLQSILIQRDGQSLHVEIVEKITTIALRTQEKTVFLDVSGAYVRDATPEESRAIDIRTERDAPQPDEAVFPLQPDMPIVINTQNETGTSLSSTTAQWCITLSEQLPRYGMHVRAMYFDGIQAPFARIDTTEPYDVYLDVGTRSIQEQLHALDAVLAADPPVIPKEYIDLRFGAYVYTK